MFPKLKHEGLLGSVAAGRGVFTRPSHRAQWTTGKSPQPAFGDFSREESLPLKTPGFLDDNFSMMDPRMNFGDKVYSLFFISLF